MKTQVLSSSPSTSALSSIVARVNRGSRERLCRFLVRASRWRALRGPIGRGSSTEGGAGAADGVGTDALARGSMRTPVGAFGGKGGALSARRKGLFRMLAPSLVSNASIAGESGDAGAAGSLAAFLRLTRCESGRSALAGLRGAGELFSGNLLVLASVTAILLLERARLSRSRYRDTGSRAVRKGAGMVDWTAVAFLVGDDD